MAVGIQVYRFSEAPRKYRALWTPEEPDESDPVWLAVVSPEYESTYWIEWLQPGAFAALVDKIEMDDGTMIYVGART